MQHSAGAPRSQNKHAAGVMFFIAAAGLVLICQKGILSGADRLMDAHPELRAAERRGTGFLWDARRALAALTWVKAQDYFHRGFTLADFIRPEDLKAFEEHEQEDLGEFRNKVMEKVSVSNLAAKPARPSAEVEAERKVEPDHKNSHEEGDASTPGDHEEESPEHEKLHQALERRFGHDTHPFMTRSLLRPYTLEHEHGVAGVPMMLPWYWLTTALDPHFTRAYANGAWWLAFIRNDLEHAKEYLRNGLRNNPGDPEILMAMGEIAMRVENNLDAAIRDFRLAVHGPNAAAPGSEIQEISWRYLVFALERAGQKDAACLEARRALAVYPNHAGFPEVAKRNCPSGAPGTSK